jgi:hypothetical protein
MSSSVMSGVVRKAFVEDMGSKGGEDLSLAWKEGSREYTSVTKLMSSEM